jgi:hypothetical protein
MVTDKSARRLRLALLIGTGFAFVALFALGGGKRDGQDAGSL